MPFDPFKIDFVLLREVKQYFPEIIIYSFLFSTAIPVICFPFFCPSFLKPIYCILRISMKGDFGFFLEFLKAGNRSHELHAIICGSRVSLREVFLVFSRPHNNSISSWSRIWIGSSIGVYIYFWEVFIVHDFSLLIFLPFSKGSTRNGVEREGIGIKKSHENRFQVRHKSQVYFLL